MGMKLRRWPIAVRMLISALVLIAVVLPVAGWLLAWNFREAVNDSFDSQLESLLHVVIANLDDQPVTGAAGALPAPDLGDPRFERVYSGWYWQVTLPDGSSVTSRSLWDQRLQESVVPGPGWKDIQGPVGQQLRMLEQRVHLPLLAAPVHVSVAADLSGVRREESRFQALLAVSLATLGALLLLLIAFQIRWGLVPLRRIERSLKRVEAGSQSALDTDLPEELSRLARTMNMVLERDQKLIERGRTAAGNLAHALKTPTAVLTSLSEQLPDEQREAFLSELSRLNEAIRHHLARASTAGPSVIGQGIDAQVALAPVLRALNTLSSRRGTRFESSVNCPAPVRFEPQDFQELVGNILENAIQWADQRVSVSISQRDGELRIQVDDDGPGMTAEERVQALARGGRLDEERSGSGLGLAIVSDLVELYNGQLELKPSPLGGLLVALVFPSGNS
ncbi:HAMP domain-containing protein [Marinobacter salinexigens]|uniref:histidine kinase n=1 Tax=Marinobacter salinexigens TaxID=2919747 RepID=A0A5B0VMR6_9GAMM|nr:ATP-binding protein [Marinobacter salinexigens]KAA1175992.1 HAMP domain-containing protein [Marinobacter salinexigens]